MSANVYFSSTCFEGNFFNTSPSLHMLHKELECKNIELSGGSKYLAKEDIIKFLHILKQENYNFLIHNYFPPPKENFILNFAADKNMGFHNAMFLFVEALEMCALFNVPYYSFHPGYLANNGKESDDGQFCFTKTSLRDYSEANKIFIQNVQEMHSISKRYSVALAIENLFINPQGIKTSLNNNFEELDQLLSCLPDDVGVLLDLGHLNVSSHFLKFNKYTYIENLITKYRDRIYELHLSENDGIMDQHLLLENDSWQIEILSFFADCKGFQKKGLNVTVESRRIPIAKMNELYFCIRNNLTKKCYIEV
ncbi:MAG: TIM barrel protein [Oligoflexia bacterium]|nr:TIM barrel protein [Oligoflexia bacterium]